MQDVPTKQRVPREMTELRNRIDIAQSHLTAKERGVKHVKVLRYAGNLRTAWRGIRTEVMHHWYMQHVTIPLVYVQLIDMRLSDVKQHAAAESVT